MHWIETWTGRQVDLVRPTADDILVDDISHALARQCRFAGHCSGYYSVAEHSVHVANLLLDGGAGLEYAEEERGALGTAGLALHGLLHDAPEAYLGDLVAPLKQTDALRGYREFETAFRLAVAAAFMLTTYPVLSVRAADRAMLAVVVILVIAMAPRGKGTPDE